VFCGVCSSRTNDLHFDICWWSGCGECRNQCESVMGRAGMICYGQNNSKGRKMFKIEHSASQRNFY
jgi:hypothetical protein